MTVAPNAVTPVAARPAAHADGPPLLVANEVSKRFGGLVAVDKVSLSIPRGAIAAVIGPNGAGKTTFFNMIAGIYQPSSGDIRYNGRVVVSGRRKMRPDQVMTLGIARTFQNIRLFANMTVAENVLVGMHCRLHTGPVGAMLRTGRVNREEAVARQRAESLLAYVGLGGKGASTAKNLSYGDQRRLEIARALASEPHLLLLDEPTAGMNPRETAQLTTFIDGMRRDLDLTILLIEHDMKVVMGVSDRVAVLDHGMKIAEGSPSEIQRDPRVIEAYLGRGAAEHVTKVPAGDAVLPDLAAPMS